MYIYTHTNTHYFAAMGRLLEATAVRSGDVRSLTQKTQLNISTWYNSWHFNR